MNDVYLCRVIEPHAHGKPQRGAQNIFTFVSAAGGKARASYLAGMIADGHFDRTGTQCEWHVEPLPYAGAMDEGALLKLFRERLA